MDRETVITHLQIIHTWAEFARERDLQFFTAKHLEDIAQWSADAIVLMKEQEQMYYTLEHDWRMCRKLLKEQETIRQCKDCKFYAGTHPEFAMCSELDICVDYDFYCKYWRTEV